jgi:hypothetical protein
MVTSSDHEFSSEPAPLPATEGLDYRNRGTQGGPMFQRIGWRRASAVERRLWLIQGAIIVGVVLLVGGLMLWILR